MKNYLRPGFGNIDTLDAAELRVAAKVPRRITWSPRGKPWFCERWQMASYGHWAVLNAIKSGFLKRGPCARCGATAKVQGHHESYAKPLNVVWLCSRHHADRHKELRTNRTHPVVRESDT